jgi:hypothetical protein
MVTCKTKAARGNARKFRTKVILLDTSLLAKACPVVCVECKIDNAVELGMNILQISAQLVIYNIDQKYSK